jgi:large subunit ribosomal protein LP0
VSNCYDLSLFQIKDYLADPSKFIAAVAAVAPTKQADAPAAKAAAPVKEVEKEESEDEDLGFGLFD